MRPLLFTLIYFNYCNWFSLFISKLISSKVSRRANKIGAAQSSYLRYQEPPSVSHRFFIIRTVSAHLSNSLHAAHRVAWLWQSCKMGKKGSSKFWWGIEELAIVGKGLPFYLEVGWNYRMFWKPTNKLRGTANCREGDHIVSPSTNGLPKPTLHAPCGSHHQIDYQWYSGFPRPQVTEFRGWSCE
jgi:hypothetical protein